MLGVLLLSIQALAGTGTCWFATMRNRNARMNSCHFGSAGSVTGSLKLAECINTANSFQGIRIQHWDLSSITVSVYIYFYRNIYWCCSVINARYIHLLTGKPVVAAPRSLVLVSPAGKVINSRGGRPVPVPRGSRITPVQHDVVLDEEGNPVLESNGLPLQVTPGDLW